MKQAKMTENLKRKQLHYPLLIGSPTRGTPTPIRKRDHDFLMPDACGGYYTDRYSRAIEIISEPPISIPEPPTTANTYYSEALDKPCCIETQSTGSGTVFSCEPLPGEAPYALLEEEEGFFGNWNVRDWARDLLSCRSYFTKFALLYTFYGCFMFMYVCECIRANIFFVLILIL